MGSVSTKEHASGAQTNHATEEPTQYPASPLSPTRLTMLQEEAADPRSPGSFKRTPVSSPQVSRPNSSYKERVLSRLAQQSNPSDPRSPAALRTPLSKLGAPVTRTPPPLSMSMSADPRSPYTSRTPLSFTGPVFVDEDVTVYDGAEVAEEVVVKENGEQAPQVPISRSVELVPSPTIVALSTSSPLNSPSLGRSKRRTASRKKPISPLAKSFSAPLPDENSSPHNLKLSAPTPAHPAVVGAKPRTPLSPLSHSRAVNSSLNCASPIKFRMDPGILG